MRVVVASRTCSHRPILEKLLRKSKVVYQTSYFEDDVELARRYDLWHSPNLIVDDAIVFRSTPSKRVPTEAELKALLEQS